MWKRMLFRNTIWHGDNLDVLRELQPESVDLVYLDPPFKSNQDYNMLYKEGDGSRSKAQEKAFSDTWKWDPKASKAFRQVLESQGPVGDVMDAFRRILATGGPRSQQRSQMLAYLSMMAPRLIELRRILKATGSLYLHCDSAASHYLKLLLDAIFGPEQFRSEITWQRTNTHSDAKRWSPVSDTILYYGKARKVTWNPPYAPHNEAYVKTKYRYQDPDGRRYRIDNIRSEE